MCESGIFVGGSLEDSRDTRTNLIVIGKGRGLTVKPPGLLLPSDTRAQGGSGGLSGQIVGAPAP
jgi:hypothetical protein